MLVDKVLQVVELTFQISTAHDLCGSTRHCKSKSAVLKRSGAKSRNPSATLGIQQEKEHPCWHKSFHKSVSCSLL
jgi:hypothetical protein